MCSSAPQGYSPVSFRGYDEAREGFYAGYEHVNEGVQNRATRSVRHGTRAGSSASAAAEAERHAAKAPKRLPSLAESSPENESAEAPYTSFSGTPMQAETAAAVEAAPEPPPAPASWPFSLGTISDSAAVAEAAVTELIYKVHPLRGAPPTLCPFYL